MKKRVDDLISELEALGDRIRPEQWKALQSLRNASLRLGDDEAAGTTNGGPAKAGTTNGAAAPA